MRFLSIFIFSFGFLVFPLQTQAQEKQIYTPKGTNWNQTQSSSGPKPSGESQTFIPKGTNWTNNAGAIASFLKQQSKSASTNKQEIKKVYVSIVHPDYLEPEQFGLLMKIASTETGCFENGPIEYESKYVGKYYMDITLKHFRRNLDNVQKPHFQCDQRQKVTSGLIVLNADELRTKGIRQIRLSNGQTRDAYDVIATENSLRLKPQSMVAFKAEGLTGPDFDFIEHKYTDNSLITLQVPMATPSDNVAQAVRNLAYEYALTPIFDGKQGKNGKNVFYFKDESGNLLDRIAADGYTEFGTVQILRPYISNKGRGGTPVNLKVFLAKPNVTL